MYTEISWFLIYLYVNCFPPELTQHKLILTIHFTVTFRNYIFKIFKSNSQLAKLHPQTHL